MSSLGSTVSALLWGSGNRAPTDEEKGDIPDVSSQSRSDHARSEGSRESGTPSAARETFKGSTVPSRIRSIFGSFFRGDSPPVKRTFTSKTTGDGNDVRERNFPGNGHSREVEIEVTGKNLKVVLDHNNSSSSPPIIRIAQTEDRQEEAAGSQKLQRSEGSGTKSESDGETLENDEARHAARHIL
jgi:hypothetical protein